MLIESYLVCETGGRISVEYEKDVRRMSYQVVKRNVAGFYAYFGGEKSFYFFFLILSKQNEKSNFKPPGSFVVTRL